MTKQEIALKVQSFLRDSVKNENVTIYEFAKKKGLDYKAFHAYLKGYRMPMYVTYIRMYLTIYGFSHKESELMARQEFSIFISVFDGFYREGHTYLWMEDITGLSHACLHKCIKHKVDDIELYTLVTLIERLNLDISIPGIIERKAQKQ